MVAVTLLAGPGGVLAASGQILPVSAIFSGALLEIMREDALQQAEEVLESTPELLPLVQSGTTLSPRSPRGADVLTVAVEGADTSFRDVPRTVWFAPFVRDVLTGGWMSGYRDQFGQLLGLFGPADPVTLEQLAKVAVEVSGRTAPDCIQGGVALVSRQAAGRWSEAAIHCAEILGWAVYSDGAEDVTRPALRREVVVTLLQAFSVQPAPATGRVFKDVPLNLPFAPFIEQAATDAIVGGYTDASGLPTGRFGPSDPVDRAAFAKIVLNARGYAGR